MLRWGYVNTEKVRYCLRIVLLLFSIVLNSITFVVYRHCNVLYCVAVLLQCIAFRCIALDLYLLSRVYNFYSASSFVHATVPYVYNPHTFNWQVNHCYLTNISKRNSRLLSTPASSGEGKSFKYAATSWRVLFLSRKNTIQTMLSRSRKPILKGHLLF